MKEIELTMEQREFLWKLSESYHNFKKNVLSEATDTCTEMAPTIAKDFGVNPLPEKFIDFLLDEIDPITWHPSNNATLDEALRIYGKWREANHYKHLKWYSLYNELKKEKYIDTTIDVFHSVMEYKHLTGKEKILWMTAKKDAIYFADSYNLSLKQLNDCFRNYDNTPFKANNRSDSVKYPLPDIIENLPTI